MSSIWAGTPLKTRIPATLYAYKPLKAMGTVSFPSEEERQQTQSDAGLQWEITVADHSRGTHNAMLRGQSSTTVEKWINVVCPQTERKESAKISWAPPY